MANKKKAANDPTSKANNSINSALAGMNEWNNNFGDWAQGAIDYGQQNPYQGAANAYINSMLGGSMGTNPWMSNLYGNVASVNMDEGMGMLRDFLGYGSGSDGNAPGGSPPRPGRPTTGNSGAWVPGGQGGYGGGGGGGYYGSSSSGGGSIPDTYDEGTKFGEQAGYFFDEARLDPRNDPTMQGMIDALQQESEESFQTSIADLQMQLEGAGQFGGSFYQAMMTNARDKYNEDIQNTLAVQYNQARQMALQKKMEALNALNSRDIAAAQIAAQEAAAAGAAASQSEAIAAQMEMANKQMQLQGIQTMLQAGQFGLGLQGDMAQLMQNGQLGALQAGMGYGQLGMMGYDNAAQFGQLGLGALGNIASINQNRISEANAMDRFNQQLAWQQQQYRDQQPFNMLNNLINSMRGLSDASGAGLYPSYVPTPQAPVQSSGWGDVLGGLAAGWGTAYNMNRPMGQGQ